MTFRLLFDVEADGLLDTITKHHCGAAEDLDTGERFEWGPKDIPQMLEVFDKADELAGHHIQGYDIPSLYVVHKWKPRATVRIRDTYICASVIHPNLRETDAPLIASGKLPKTSPSDGKAMSGRHTIEAWGYRLGIPKVGADITEWAEWTQAIQDRCVGDVSTNVRLYKHLQIEKYSQQALDLEHRIRRVTEAMTTAGWPFNVEEAEKLYTAWTKERYEIEQSLVEQYGSWLARISPDPRKYTYTPKVKGAGIVLKDLGLFAHRPKVKLHYTPGCQVSKLEQITFNPGSTQHIAKVLMDRGWKPTEFTPGGKPTVDETVISGLVERFPAAEGIARYLMLNKRISQLGDGEQAWLKVVGPDKRIHASYNPMGTITSRAAHFQPNIGQVPSSASPYGAECRALFTAPAGMVMIGADMAGLELRCLAHYLAKNDGGEYGRAVLGGDPHWMTVQALGFVDAGTERDKMPDDTEPTPRQLLHNIVREHGAKRWLYAIIYGGGGLQSGLIILEACQAALKAGLDIFPRFFKTQAPKEEELRSVGSKAKKNFVKRIGGLSALNEKIAALVESRGYIPGLDMRRIPSRSSHSALNFLLQSAGAILCKQWACDAFENLCARFKLGEDFVFLGWIHDELQVAARPEIAEEVGETLVRFARSAGEPFGFRIPLDSKYKTGSHWGHTH